MIENSKKFTFAAFGGYFVSANINRIQGLMACEIENLIEYHWNLLIAEQKENDCAINMSEEFKKRHD